MFQPPARSRLAAWRNRAEERERCDGLPARVMMLMVCRRMSGMRKDGRTRQNAGTSEPLNSFSMKARTSGDW